MNNTAGAFLELKTFLTGVELTSQKIKANLADGKKSKPFIGKYFVIYILINHLFISHIFIYRCLYLCCQE